MEEDRRKGGAYVGGKTKLRGKLSEIVEVLYRNLNKKITSSRWHIERKCVERNIKEFFPSAYRINLYHIHYYLYQK